MLPTHVQGRGQVPEKPLARVHGDPQLFLILSDLSSFALFCTV